MSKDFIRNVIIITGLGLLTISSFFVRLDNVIRTQKSSIDEVVYYRMAEQVHQNWKDYNTIPYGQQLASTGRDLPDYFFKKLFKHPPLFTFFAVLSFNMFGVTKIAAYYVSLLFGVLLIPLVYLFAKLLFSRKVAVLAAILMWLEPVNTITSQKIWLDTQMSFFMTASLYCYFKGVKTQNMKWLITAFLLSGGAVLTKYTGILSWGIMLLHSVFCAPHLYRRRIYYSALWITPLMLLPWIGWNLAVYKNSFFMDQIESHNLYLSNPRTWLLISGGLMLMGAVIFYIKYALKNHSEERCVASASFPFLLVTRLIIFGCLWIILFPSWLKGLDPLHIPAHGWQQGLFADVTPFFYFEKLLEWSPIFIFAYVGFFCFRQKHKNEKDFLISALLVYFLFFMVWGTFQSRYILPAIPLLLMFALQIWCELLEKVKSYPNKNLAAITSAMLYLFLAFTVINAVYLNLFLTFKNDMCYF